MHYERLWSKIKPMKDQKWNTEELRNGELQNNGKPRNIGRILVDSDMHDIAKSFLQFDDLVYIFFYRFASPQQKCDLYQDSTRRKVKLPYSSWWKFLWRWSQVVT